MNTAHMNTTGLKLISRFAYSAVCLLLMASNANADFYVFLQNKLGDDREVTYLFSQITNETGDVIGNPGRLSNALQPKKLLRLGSKQSTNTLEILNLMVIEYRCIDNPNSTDCWSFDPDFLSFPNGPLSCDFMQNITIDTSDKIVSGSGTTGQATYETQQVRIVLNKDFTVSYRVLRRNPATGIWGRSEENMTVINNGMACKLTNN